LGIADSVVEMGAVPYESLHHLYRACDIYVSPAYAETFAHPLVEAMASGLPVVASDLPIHREVCCEAATYFPRFSCECLADAVANIAGSLQEHSRLPAGRERVINFDWEEHVRHLLCRAAAMDRAKDGPLEDDKASYVTHLPGERFLEAAKGTEYVPNT
jgi:glycosyltransferase involved in cell wall biosynthesis